MKKKEYGVSTYLVRNNTLNKSKGNSINHKCTNCPLPGSVILYKKGLLPPARFLKNKVFTFTLDILLL